MLKKVMTFFSTCRLENEGFRGDKLMEIVHIAVGDYPEYEALLLQRDQLKKEALQYRRAYIREFGELINKVFEKKIECIRLKKSIAFCQIARNKGQKPDIAAMNEYIAQKVKEYRQQLDILIGGAL